MKSALYLLAAGLLAAAPLLHAQEPAPAAAPAALVDEQAANGSFESGSLAPWQYAAFQVSKFDGNFPNNTCKVLEDAKFASQGTRYAELCAAGDPGGKRCVARLDLVTPDFFDLANGRNFEIAYDVRNGATGFTMTTVEFLGFDEAQGGRVVMATGETLGKQPLAADKWARQTVQCRFPEGGKIVRLQLRLCLLADGTTPGATYQGFFDHIVIKQSK